ncbi:MAG: hypothetical protein LBM98_06000 [Oscillospiraceae bacterium]|nr:hypothetical protein [Oscillospiraceae bacterium]
MPRRSHWYVSHAYRGSQRRRTAPGRGEGGWTTGGRGKGGFETRPYVPGGTNVQTPVSDI